MTGDTGAAEESRASFGFREVRTGDKQRLVDRVFDRVASRYDLMNDLMSGGLHRAWKGAMVSWLAPPPGGKWSAVDVAGGTGDIAFRILDRTRQAHVTVADINAEMLAVGAKRAATKTFGQRIDFVEANAEDLPFPSGHFDAFTIAFGIRNVPRIEQALAEAFRVLKPGGRFLCLEFSAVDVAGLDRLYELYSFNVIPALGGIVAGDAESYRYLVESIRRFPNQGRFAAMIRDAGFSKVEVRNLSGGIAALQSGWKI
ncbi:MAG: bifunctional demethylmenaquinone methyltransferase/2-methoxy-6-polyprenyl-1,4-benzoquinol methylase UbiE [Bauldia sp.]